MRVLTINTSERIGGAAIAASRLTQALNASGLNVQMLVLHKSSQSATVRSIGKPWQKKYTFIRERIVIWINNLFSRKNLFSVSIANTGFHVTRLPEFQQADVIHLHWINQGMLSLNNIREIIRSGKPIVWTLHDMWECTAICHHAHGCELFQSECRNCPFLRLPGKHDLANRVFKKKQKLFKDADLNIVTVSTWLATQVRKSTLLKEKEITVIPNTISLSDFKMMNKKRCREELSLPDKHLILFGAARLDDPIKGFDFLLQAINRLIETNKFSPEQLHLILFGKIKHPDHFLPKIPVSYTNMGFVTDSSLLSKLYSAADIALSTSLYETFGQTLIEAQACGCFPVSFNNSGQTDIIQHQVNGYLAEYLSVESLAEGIDWGLTQAPAKISGESMRKSVLQKYSGEIIAEQYIRLYQKLIKKQQ